MTVGPAPDLDVDHPAKFSIEVLEALDLIVPTGVPILDPYAGVGYIHRLVGRDTWGLELEPEWATVHPRTVVGNALHLPWRSSSWWWVVTSCTYGNRMADSHDARERCKPCAGKGYIEVMEDPDAADAVPDGRQECEKCEGRGFRSYVRLTYTHRLRASTGNPDRTLHPDNSGTLQWGEAYRTHHVQSWAEVWRVLNPGGKFVLNLKNHWRDHGLKRVMEWHLTHLLQTGFDLEALEVVETKGMGMGQNRDAREPHEFVLVLVKR